MASSMHSVTNTQDKPVETEEDIVGTGGAHTFHNSPQRVVDSIISINDNFDLIEDAKYNPNIS